MNISPKVMKEVQFGLIANGILKAEAKDVGTFSPNAEIKHKYGIPASTFPIGTGCRVRTAAHPVRGRHEVEKSAAAAEERPHLHESVVVRAATA